MSTEGCYGNWRFYAERRKALVRHYIAKGCTPWKAESLVMDQRRKHPRNLLRKGTR